MAGQYDDTNRFALFPNEKRNDRSPDFSGTLDVNGQKFFIDAWSKEGRNGQFFSGSIKLKEKQEQGTTGQQRQQQSRQQNGGGRPSSTDMDDEIPFAPEWRG